MKDEWRLGYIQYGELRLNPYETFSKKEFCENFIKQIHMPRFEFFPVHIIPEPSAAVLQVEGEKQ